METDVALAVLRKLLEGGTGRAYTTYEVGCLIIDGGWVPSDFSEEEHALLEELINGDQTG